MDLQYLVVIVVLLIAIWWLIRKRREAQPDNEAPAARQRKKPTAYHAVSIKFSANACNAAKAMAGRRFLASAAPRIPLPDCDALECNCQFVHHDDRRSGKDRRSPFAPAARMGGLGGQEQRAGKDRRRASANDDDLY